jgi:hypothetical protein
MDICFIINIDSILSSGAMLYIGDFINGFIDGMGSIPINISFIFMLVLCKIY